MGAGERLRERKRKWNPYERKLQNTASCAVIKKKTNFKKEGKKRTPS